MPRPLTDAELRERDAKLERATPAVSLGGGGASGAPDLQNADVAVALAAAADPTATWDDDGPAGGLSFTFRGVRFRARPATVREGIELAVIRAELHALAQTVNGAPDAAADPAGHVAATRAAGEQMLALADRAARLFHRSARPVSRWHRVLYRLLGLVGRGNPFQRMTDRDAGRLIALFWTCRMRTSVTDTAPFPVGDSAVVNAG